jgi:hypothetical protein
MEQNGATCSGDRVVARAMTFMPDAFAAFRPEKESSKITVSLWFALSFLAARR